MDAAGISLTIVNVVFALGGGWLLASRFSRLPGIEAGRVRLFAGLLGVYLIEGVAFAASMATDALSIALAVVWGLVLGRRLPRSKIPAGARPRFVGAFALFTGLPALSFSSVPVVVGLAGRPILDSEAGEMFGIPGFLPWPFDTILGFCVAVALFAVAAKLIVTKAVSEAVMRRGCPA